MKRRSFLYGLKARIAKLFVRKTCGAELQLFDFLAQGKSIREAREVYGSSYSRTPRCSLPRGHKGPHVLQNTR